MIISRCAPLAPAGHGSRGGDHGRTCGGTALHPVPPMSRKLLGERGIKIDQMEVSER
jgi:hypothetical protein